MLRLLRHLLFLVSFTFTAGIVRDVRANDAAAAQVLFNQGKKLMAEGKYAEACAKLEESQKQDPGLGTQMNLAICYESMGRTATAWSLYLDVASQAKATGQVDREKKARDAAKALEPKLSSLTIVVDAPATGIEVKRNGQTVAQVMWRTPLPVDPGQVRITAVAPNRKLWESTITINAPGDTTVTVPELQKSESPPGHDPPSTTASQSDSKSPGGEPPLGLRSQPMKRRSGSLFGIGIATTVVGGLAIIGGGAGVLIEGKRPQSENPYPEFFTSLGVLAGGMLLMGGGIAMIVIGNKNVPVGPTDAKSTAALSLVPEIQVGLPGARLKWEFTW